MPPPGPELLEARLLGAAAGGGFPQWNCACAGCRRAWDGDPAARPRTQAGLAVRAGHGRWLLCGASPDLRQQILATPGLRPAVAGRDSPIAAVVLCNADVDQIAGLLTLRERAAFAVYATGRVHEALAASRLFDVLDEHLVARRTLRPGEPVVAADATGASLGLTIEAVPVPGKVARWLEDPAAPRWGTADGDTIAVDVRAVGRPERLVWAPSCAAITADVRRRLEGAEVVCFDGTVHRDDDLARAGVDGPTGRRMGHVAMDGPEGSIAGLAGARIGRRVFVHLNNTNPVLLADSAERASVVAAGWEVGEDGMVLLGGGVA